MEFKMDIREITSLSTKSVMGMLSKDLIPLLNLTALSEQYTIPLTITMASTLLLKEVDTQYIQYYHKLMQKL